MVWCTFLATLGNPWWGLAAITLAGVGSKCAATLFWPMAQTGLDLRIAAPGLALINSLGNLGGFVSPFLFGYLKDTTGSTTGGLYTLSAASLLAVAGARFIRGAQALDTSMETSPEAHRNPEGGAQKPVVS